MEPRPMFGNEDLLEMMELEDILGALVAELLRRGRLKGAPERFLVNSPEQRYALATTLMSEYLTYPLSDAALVPFNYCALGALVPWIAPLLSPVCSTPIDAGVRK